MKKHLILLLVSVLVFSAFGCAKENEPEPQAPTEPSKEQQAELIISEDVFLKVGDTYQLQPQVIGFEVREYHYQAETDDIVSVDETGLVTALGRGMEIVHITAIPKDISNYSSVTRFLFVLVEE